MQQKIIRTFLSLFALLTASQACAAVTDVSSYYNRKGNAGKLYCSYRILSPVSSTEIFLSTFGSTYDQSLIAMDCLLRKSTEAITILDFFADQFVRRGVIYVSYNVDNNYYSETDVRFGEMLWVGMAMFHYERMTGDLRYHQTLIDLANYIKSFQQTDGRFWGGPYKTWASTEHNIDAYIFYGMMAALTKDPQYEQIQNKVKGWLLNIAYNSAEGRFNRGQDDSKFATDTHTWGVLALEDVMSTSQLQGLAQYLETHCNVDYGFDFTNRKQAISYEWTLHMPQAYQILGQGDKANNILSKVETILNTSSGIPYSSQQIDTTHGWTAYTYPSMASLIWYSFSKNGFNPFTYPITFPPAAINTGSYTNDRNKFSASWFPVPDDLSGNTSYFYQISKSTGFGQDLTPLINVGTSTSATHLFSPMLSESTYYWKIYAKKPEQVMSSACIAGVLLDTTAPSIPLQLRVDSQPDAVSAWKNNPVYQLSWTNPADKSGIKKAYFKEGQTMTSTQSVNSANYTLADQTFMGSHSVFIWLEDNAGNQNQNNYGIFELRYDAVPPISTAQTSVSASTVVAPIEIHFSAADQPLLSGISGVKLFYRLDADDDGEFGNWVEAVIGQTSVADGTFTFTPPNSGQYEFRSQAFDAAGNTEPTKSFADVSVFFDSTPAMISNVNVPKISANTVLLEWITDDHTMTEVKYGTTSLTSDQLSRFGGISETSTDGTLILEENVFSKQHSILLTNLISPATIYYSIFATNRTGLVSTATGVFVTQPQLIVPGQVFAAGSNHGIRFEISNPSISTVTFILNPGESNEQVIVAADLIPGVGYEIHLDTAYLNPSSQNIIEVRVDGFPSIFQDFLVDTVQRSNHLSNFVNTSAGELMGEGTASVMDSTAGEVMQEIFSNTSVFGKSELMLGYYANLDPKPPGMIMDLSAQAGPGNGEITLSWTAPGDDDYVGKAMRYDLRSQGIPLFTPYAAVPVPLPDLPGRRQQFIVKNLTPGTSYFFSLKTEDEAENFSTAALVMARTWELTTSTNTINNQPVIEFYSQIPGMSITVVSTNSASSLMTLAAGAIQSQGLIMASFVYDIVQPNNAHEIAGGATIQFRFSDFGTEAETNPTFGIYEFRPDLSPPQWIFLTDAKVFPAYNYILAPVPGLSLFAIMFKDQQPPLTLLDVRCQTPDAECKFTDPNGSLFVSANAIFNLSAVDPPADKNGQIPGSGVSKIEYRLDSTISDFLPWNNSFSTSTLASLFALTNGIHFIQFRSVDTAGNSESIRSIAVRVDLAAPNAQFTFSQDSYAVSSGTFISSRTIISVQISDPANDRVSSKLKEIQFSLDQSSFLMLPSEIPNTFSFNISTAGEHSLQLTLKDQVGNQTQIENIVFVDTLPAHAKIQPPDGLHLMMQDAQLITGPTLQFVIEDTFPDGQFQYGQSQYGQAQYGQASGGAGVEYSIDGEALNVFTGIIFVPGGTHSLIYRAFDRVNNFEPFQTADLIIDTAPPRINVAESFTGKIFTNDRDGVITATVTITDDYDPSSHYEISLVQVISGPAKAGQAGEGKSLILTAGHLPLITGHLPLEIDPLTIPAGEWVLQVKAQDRFGNVMSTVTGSFFIQHPGLARPQPPAKIRSREDGQTFVISWTPVTMRTDGSSLQAGELTGYNLYKMESLRAQEKLIVTVPVLSSSTSMTPDQSGGRLFTTQTNSDHVCYYKVRAVNIDGLESDASHIVSSDHNVLLMADDKITYVKLSEDMMDQLETKSMKLKVERDVSQESGVVFKVVHIKTINEQTGEDQKNYAFHAPLELAFGYYIDENGKISSEVAGAPSSIPLPRAQDAQKSVSIYWHNGLQWLKVGTRPNVTNETVTLPVKYSGSYQLRLIQPAGTPQLNVVYPKTISPNDDRINDHVFFVFENTTDAPANGTIYDRRSFRVADLKLASAFAGAGAGSTVLEWDGKDDSGAVVRGGVYLYKIEIGNRRFTGTVAVAR